MNINLEQTILRNLLTNEEYTRRVLPFLAPDYFEGVYKDLFKEVAKFVSKYNKIPTLESFKIEVDEGNRLSEENYRQAIEMLPNIFTAESENLDWLVERTEKWCQDRSVYNAVMESISIIDGKHATLQKNAIPDVLSKALGVSFDTNIGHDYLEQVDERYDYYHEQEERIPFDLENFNKITKGGLPNKTLNIALAGTGVGKSLFMCHLASNILAQGRNVLYITMEMAEEKIAERIDANLLNVNIQNITELPKPMFESKVNNITKKTQGTLIIKEYPTAAAHSGHFKSLLNELALKKSFVPDIIFIDYLNICASSRYRTNNNVNSYSYIKAIAEELRGLAVEANVPIVSATQTTRSGYGSSDVDLTDTSESFGLPATADLMFALISTEELEEQNQIMVKQLKNRYNDPTIYKRFVIGIDRAKMRLYDCEQKAQDDILDNGQEEDYNKDEKVNKKSFAEFNF